MAAYRTGLFLAVFLASGCTGPAAPAQDGADRDAAAVPASSTASATPAGTPVDDAGPLADTHVWAEYPEAIRGEWTEQDAGCPINYDGESFLSISADVLAQYENTSRALGVEVVVDRPPTWRITSAFSPGTGEYEGREDVVFELEGERLLIGTGDREVVYVRCG